MTRHAEKGSVITYILLVIFLMGVLTMSMSEGPKKNAQTQKLDGLGLSLAADISLIESSVNDCVLVYPAPVDIDDDGDKDATDNPNAPFPKIYDSTTGYADSGDIAKTICPGSPPTPLTPPATAAPRQLLVNAQSGRSFKVLGDTTTYTTLFTSDTTEGVYIRITRSSANTLWTEAISRINERFSPCKAAVVTAGGVCANSCFYYWIKRLPTSVLGPEPGPDPAQCTL